MDVPALANEIHARRRPAVPVPPMPPLPAAPPVPPPFPGAPRRPTGTSFPVASAGGCRAPARPTGCHGLVPPPVSRSGRELPPPVGGRKSPTGLVSTVHRVAAAGAASTADEPELDVRSASPSPPAPAHAPRRARRGPGPRIRRWIRGACWRRRRRCPRCFTGWPRTAFRTTPTWTRPGRGPTALRRTSPTG